MSTSRLCAFLVAVAGCATAACDGPGVEGGEEPANDAGAGPGGGGGEDAGDEQGAAPDAGAPAPERPAFCPAASDKLVDMTKSPAGPYLVRVPKAPADPAHTVLFLPGGAGTKSIANVVEKAWLRQGNEAGEFLLVIPYTNDSNLYDETKRFWAAADEARRCFGVGEGPVHLGGTSNGGAAAFDLALAEPDRFLTLLGAPGLWQKSPSDATLTKVFAGKSLFLGVGEKDSATWKSAAMSTYTRADKLGIDAVLDIFAGQGHILTESFDESALFEFWRTHPR